MWFSCAAPALIPKSWLPSWQHPQVFCRVAEALDLEGSPSHLDTALGFGLVQSFWIKRGAIYLTYQSLSFSFHLPVCLLLGGGGKTPLISHLSVACVLWGLCVDCDLVSFFPFFIFFFKSPLPLLLQGQDLMVCLTAVTRVMQNNGNGMALTWTSICCPMVCQAPMLALARVVNALQRLCYALV